MATKPRTNPLAEAIARQHLALSVAAHLARTQLVPDPTRIYDLQHLSEMLNVVAASLARTAPLYVFDAPSGEPRQLTPEELEGASAKRSANQLVLKNGRALSGVSIRRADLRQAISALKASGLPEIVSQVAVPAAPNPRPKIELDPGALLARLGEIERWLAPPLLPAQIEQAKSAALFIARHAPHGRVANLAMQLMSALHEPRDAEDEAPGGYRMALARLRAALEQKAS